MITFEERFLQATQASYEMFLEHGPRSTEKLKVFHGWVQDELKRELGDEYNFTGYTPDDGKEALISGLYYDKRVDVLISRGGQELGVVSIKFVISNYWQNSVNYLEQQLGETANLRRKNIVYGNLFCVTNPIPYNRRSGEIARYEHLREHDIQRYARLVSDRGHAHAPDEMAIGIVDLDIQRNAISGITDVSTLKNITEASREVLRNELSLPDFFPRMAKHIREKRYSQ